MYASGFESIRIRGRGIAAWGLGLALVGVLFIGASGALTALGDTLYPSASFSQGFQQDFSNLAPLLIRLRVIHPLIAVVVAFYTLFVAGLLGYLHNDHWVKRFSLVICILFVCQLVAGLVNIMLLAPVWMQIIHLLLADLVWITLVLLSTATFSETLATRKETEDHLVASQPPVSVRQAGRL
jgi:heme A synthase